MEQKLTKLQNHTYGLKYYFYSLGKMFESLQYPLPPQQCFGKSCSNKIVTGE